MNKQPVDATLPEPLLPPDMTPLFVGRIRSSFMVVINHIGIYVTRHVHPQQRSPVLSFDGAVAAARRAFAAYVFESQMTAFSEEDCRLSEKSLLKQIEEAQIERVVKCEENNRDDFLDATIAVILPSNGQPINPPETKEPMVVLGDETIPLDEYLRKAAAKTLAEPKKRRKPARVAKKKALKTKRKDAGMTKAAYAYRKLEQGEKLTPAEERVLAQRMEVKPATDSGNTPEAADGEVQGQTDRIKAE